MAVLPVLRITQQVLCGGFSEPPPTGGTACTQCSRMVQGRPCGGSKRCQDPLAGKDGPCDKLADYIRGPHRRCAALLSMMIMDIAGVALGTAPGPLGPLEPSAAYCMLCGYIVLIVTLQHPGRAQLPADAQRPQRWLGREAQAT